METLRFNPQNVCSREMIIHHENGVIIDAEVIGGCRGNLQGICSLIRGRKVEDVVKALKGIQCRNGTSCPDQMARGLEKHLL